MSRIPREYLDCAVFLYPNEVAAKKGAGYGGSGFLVALPFETVLSGPQRSHIYVITNSHVVRECKSPVIRLNSINGQSAILNLSYDAWIDDWATDDLALYMLDDTQMANFQWLAPFSSGVVLPEDIENGDVDVGSDIATISRFVGYDGIQSNQPIVRFGNLSALNWQSIQHNLRRELKQDSFLVDCRAIGGSSGAPVFLTHSPSNDRVQMGELLGIVWGSVPVRETVRHKTNGEQLENLYVNDNTGMMLVIPAWKLLAFLNRSNLVEKRRQIEVAARKKEENDSPPGAVSVGAPDDSEIDFTRNDFLEALRKVSKPKDDQPDEGKSETSE